MKNIKTIFMMIAMITCTRIIKDYIEEQDFNAIKNMLKDM